MSAIVAPAAMAFAALMLVAAPVTLGASGFSTLSAKAATSVDPSSPDLNSTDKTSNDSVDRSGQKSNDVGGQSLDHSGSGASGNAGSNGSSHDSGNGGSGGEGSDH